MSRKNQDHKYADAHQLCTKFPKHENYVHIDCVNNLMRLFQDPLNVIISLSQLIRVNQQVPLEDEDSIAKIQESATQLLNLSNQLLDLSRVKAGQLKLASNSVELNDVFSEVFAQVQEFADSKEVTLHQHIDDNVPKWIITDDRRLGQILRKLLNNAIRLTQQGSVTLSVSSTEEWLRFEISDTGTGMTEERLLSLFNNHYHIVRSQKEGMVASGLGLSLAKYLIQHLGGEITFSSQLGVGTRVMFTLPLITIDGIDEGYIKRHMIHDHQESTEIPSTSPLFNKRVLLVEDSTINQDVAMKMLQKLGINPVVAGNGEEALQLRKTEKFDLILMDIQMPIKDGYQTVTEIREEERRTGQYQIIIALSVNGSQSDFYTAGMDDYITKPIDFNILLEKLNYWLLEQ